MLLLSYPRSGSNFLNYCVEEITGNILGKTHGQYKEFWINGYNGKLILMIRNYKECIPRQINNYNFDDKFKSQISNYRTDNDIHYFDYISVLDYYDKYAGPKIIIYYEDFISNIKNDLLKVMEFMKDEFSLDENVYISILDKFMENIDYHKKISSEKYQSIVPDGCKSIVDTEVDFHFHRKKMDKETIKKIDSYIKKKYYKLYKKYLNRYDEVF